MTLKKTLCLVFTLLLAVMLAVSCDFSGSGDGGSTELPPTPEITLTKIEVVDGTVDTECYEGMEIDTSRIELRATYSNGTRKTIPTSEVTIISPADTRQAGQTMLIVGYGGLSTSVTITVNESFISAISASGFEEQYVYGSQISTENVVITVYYINGTSETIPYKEGVGISIILPDTNVIGLSTIQISYMNAVTKSYDVEIIDPIVRIELDNPHRTFEFKKGSDVSTIKSVMSNLKLNAVYTSGHTEVINFSSLAINYNQIDTSEFTTEPKQFNISYGGFTIKGSYTVNDVSRFTAMTLDATNTFVTEYLPGQTLNPLTNLKVKVLCSDGTSIDAIGAENLTIAGYESIDVTKIDAYSITVTYVDGDDGISMTIPVTIYGVSSVSVSGVKTTYALGDKLDNSFAGVTVTIVYENGETVVVDYASKEDNANIVPSALVTSGSINTEMAGFYTIAFKYFDVLSEEIRVTVSSTVLPDTNGDSNVTDKDSFKD